jgi:Cu2+-containing amine oxidase
MLDLRDNRGAFSKHGIWVTKYNKNELFAAGNYGWQQPINSGLPEYIKNK